VSAEAIVIAITISVALVVLTVSLYRDALRARAVRERYLCELYARDRELLHMHECEEAMRVWGSPCRCDAHVDPEPLIDFASIKDSKVESNNQTPEALRSRV
jgi:hypothetical protein